MVKLLPNKQQMDRNIPEGEMVALGHKINEAAGGCTQETEWDWSIRYGREFYTESVGEWLFQTLQRPEQILLQFGSSWIYDSVKAWLLLHESFSDRSRTPPCHKAGELQGKPRAQPALLIPAWKVKPEADWVLLQPLISQKRRQLQNDISLEP